MSTARHSDPRAALSVLAAADEAPDAAALVDGDDTLTYRSLANAVRARMVGLLRAGVGATGAPTGNRLALVGRPDRATVVSLLAAMELGVPVAFLHARWTAAERARALEIARPRLVLDREHPDAGDGSAELAGIVRRAAPPQGGTLAMVFTSGTTGEPRAAVLSRRAFVAAAERQRGRARVARRRRVALRDAARARGRRLNRRALPRRTSRNRPRAGGLVRAGPVRPRARARTREHRVGRADDARPDRRCGAAAAARGARGPRRRRRLSAARALRRRHARVAPAHDLRPDRGVRAGRDRARRCRERERRLRSAAPRRQRRDRERAHPRAVARGDGRLARAGRRARAPVRRARLLRHRRQRLPRRARTPARPGTPDGSGRHRRRERASRRGRGRARGDPGHPGRVVFGIPDERWGAIVLAAIEVGDETGAPGDGDIARALSGRLAPFKVPRRIVRVPVLATGPSGKLDRAAVRARLGG